MVVIGKPSSDSQRASKHLDESGNTMNPHALSAHDEAARLLDAHPDYKVMRRLSPVTRFHDPDPALPTRVAVLVDCETTGLDHEGNKIIELALQRFRYDVHGRIVEVGAPRVWFEDPGSPLDPEITRITGINDEMLRDQAIDDGLAITILESADKIIAHNAAFDRPFLDKRFPAIAGKEWACSMAEPDWKEHGFEGRALGYLLSQCGWFFDGHRAENDILALLYLLAHELPDGRTVLADLIACSDRPTLKVNAVDAPYDAKDILKARSYRWNPVLRFWSKEIPEADRAGEATWLKSKVYHGHYGQPAFLSVDARQRYTAS